MSLPKKQINVKKDREMHQKNRDYNKQAKTHDGDDAADDGGDGGVMMMMT